MSPYAPFVQDTIRIIENARKIPLPTGVPGRAAPPSADAPKALFFSPHPDDECISGAPALRLLRQGRMQVLNVAVTQGSNKARQPERFEELRAACDYLGYGLLATIPNGLERINPKTRHSDPGHWASCVSVIETILRKHQPKVVLMPHDRDWNSTHIGTHFLVMDALARLGPGFECFIIETEFWGAMDDPNLMVEIHPDDVADLIAALAYHAGEISRNPYHLSLPAWLMDNVRRGSELVGGQGGGAPSFHFAVLNRLRKWQRGKASRFYEGGRILPCSVDIGSLLHA